MTNNLKAGDITCPELARQLEAKGRVVIVGGPSVSSVIDRIRGCTEALARCPGIEVGNDSQNPEAGRDGGFAAMWAYMTRFPKIQGVFPIKDDEAIGANLAAEQGGRSEMKIAAVDGSPEVVAMLYEAQSRIVASAAQNPDMMGWSAVKLGWEIKSGKAPEVRVVLLGPRQITAANVREVGGWPQKK